MPFKKFKLFRPFRLASSAIRRYFTELASIGSQHYTIPEVTLSGDFEYAFEFTTTSTAEQGLCGHIDTVQNFVRLHSGGKIQVKTDSATTTFDLPVSDYRDGKIQSGVLSRVSGTMSLVVSAEDLGSFTNTGDLNISILGASASTSEVVSHLDGIISNVKITDAGTLVRWYEIKETWANDLVLKDVSGNAQHGAAVNVTAADSERYTFNKQDNAWWDALALTFAYIVAPYQQKNSFEPED